MSLTSAIHSAISGLGVVSRRAEMVSNNIANATTEGYARRSLSLQPGTLSPGVRATAVLRDVDANLLRETRLAGAEAEGTALLARNLARIEAAYGTPGQEGGIAQSISRLETALISAAADPSSETRLAGVADAVTGLARQFARTSTSLQTIRQEADSRIAADVERVNDNLARLEKLDRQIVSLRAAGRDVSSFLDQRQSALDQIAQILPVKEQERGDGRLALVTGTGLVLYDGRAAQFGFSRTPGLSAGPNPQPSGLTLNGTAVPTGPDGPVAGGRLGAAFQLRDDIAPQVQIGLDALAAQMIDRLAAADPTLPPGAAGLLTDGGAAADPQNRAGLSLRLRLNPIVDEARGGSLWPIRSGLAATAPGPVAEASLLSAMVDQLTHGVQTPALSAAALLDTVSHHRVTAEVDATQAAARASVLGGQVAAAGVNTDSELQDLMQIEKAYAANARVLQAVDEMLQFLLGR